MTAAQCPGSGADSGMTARADNIILVGFMATGKSHVGRILARLTGRRMADIDEEIVRRAGKPIHRIFNEDGEAVFRAMERHAALTLCARDAGEPGKVIAAGGGAFAQETTRQVLLDSGQVLCLTARPETIHQRILRGSPSAAARPMLAGDDPLQRIRQLLAERAEAYRHAHHFVATDDRTPEQVAEAALRILNWSGNDDDGRL